MSVITRVQDSEWEVLSKLSNEVDGEFGSKISKILEQGMTLLPPLKEVQTYWFHIKIKGHKSLE